LQVNWQRGTCESDVIAALSLKEKEVVQMRTQTYLLKSSEGIDSDALGAFDGKQTLVLAYCSSDWASASPILNAVKRSMPNANLVGLSTAGHFACSDFDRPEIFDDEVLLHVITLERGRFYLSSELSDPVGSTLNAERLVQSIPESELNSLRLLLVYTDGGHTDGDAFMDEMQRALPRTVPVSGGMAGDGARFENTWIWDGVRRIDSGGIVVAVCGDLIVSCGTGGGWDSFGIDRTVTEANGAELVSLDGRSVLDLYEEYLGDRSQELPGSALLFPLMISNEERGESVVRTVLGVNRERGSMKFAGTIREGSRARLMRANANRLVDAAERACTSSVDRVRSQGAVGEISVLAVSCVGRRLALRQRASEAAEAVAELYGDSVKVAGFYSYGEFAASGVRVCALHNQTFTVAVIGELGAVPSAA
jgi:hypothetical protein